MANADAIRRWLLGYPRWRHSELGGVWDVPSRDVVGDRLQWASWFLKRLY